MTTRLALMLMLLAATASARGETTRFCLEGEFDLGARFQGTHAQAGEFYPVTWCVTTDGETERALFSGAGQSNPDMHSSFEVAYLPPDLVRIVNRDDPPDIEFHGTDHSAEARKTRRLDPHRLAAEYLEFPQRFDNLDVDLEKGLLKQVRAMADLPLRGRVPVTWTWDWSEPDLPRATLKVDDQVMLRGVGRWEVLEPAIAGRAWLATPNAEPVELAGDLWPAQVAMDLLELAEGVFLVRGVRTGFQHLVIDTGEGLVVGDAPAGWVELHQLPPTDLVPGLGVSGLSEKFIDFLAENFAGRPIAAVVLTHAHDDHAGGARAFAAAGARVYAPAPVERFLERALNRANMPPDRLRERVASIDIIPVAEAVTIGAGQNRARVLPMGANPHVDAMLGLWAVDRDYFFVSDVHVPNSEAPEPRAERALTECWFAGWANNVLPESVKVVNSHSRIETPLTTLAGYLDSPSCR